MFLFLLGPYQIRQGEPVDILVDAGVQPRPEVPGGALMGPLAPGLRVRQTAAGTSPTTAWARRWGTASKIVRRELAAI